MEINATQKYIGATPRKLRLVADMIRTLPPQKALEILEFTPKDAARDLSKAIMTAMANAKQKGMELSKAGFKKIEINEGPKLRRFRAGTKGRAKPYKKRTSHIKIVLSDDLKLKPQKSKVKTEAKKSQNNEIEARSGQFGNESKLKKEVG